MIAFDPLRAAREELTGLVEIDKLISTRTAAAEQRMAEAEADYNGLVKLRGFIRGMVGRQQDKVSRLEDEAAK